jgi:hypothetical protein
MGAGLQSHMCHIEKEQEKEMKKSRKRKRLHRGRGKGEKEREYGVRDFKVTCVILRKS